MAEAQSAHRQELEKAVVQGNIADAKRGQNYAFILGLVAIAGGIGLIAFGRPVENLVSVIGALATLAGVFIWGRSQQRQERQQKSDQRDTARTPN